MNDARDDRLRELLAALDEDFRAPPELRHDVMTRVRAIPDPIWKQAADWLLRPRTLRVSPAAGGLAVAGLLVLTVFRPFGGGVAPTAPGGPSGAATDSGIAIATAGASATEPRTTRFVFVASEVSSVRMTGDFIAWDPEGIALEDLRGTGIWTVDVPLPPGVHQYTFIVNGTEWRPDPRAVSQVDDGFGQTNSVVIVPGSGEA